MAHQKAPTLSLCVLQGWKAARKLVCLPLFQSGALLRLSQPQWGCRYAQLTDICTHTKDVFIKQCVCSVALSCSSTIVGYDASKHFWSTTSLQTIAGSSNLGSAYHKSLILMRETTYTAFLVGSSPALIAQLVERCTCNAKVCRSTRHGGIDIADHLL